MKKKTIFMLSFFFAILFAIMVMPNKAFAYTLTFDSNGGTGTMNEINDITSFWWGDVTNTFIAPEGKIFVGWSLSNDNNTTTQFTYSLDLTKDEKLYAIWKTPITEATATITAPAGEALPDINPVSGNSSMYSAGGQNHLTDAQWSTNFDYYIEHSKTTAFTTGNDYTLYMAFRAADGYCFTSETVFKINGNVSTGFPTTGDAKFIRGEKCKFTATEPTPAEKATINVTINDYSTANRGKFSIANNVNSDKPESTSSLSVELDKNCNATLYVTPELDYIIEKITVGGNEVSFVKDSTASGVNKPYKTTITMNADKNVVIYFKAKKTLKYNLSATKKSTNIEKVDSTTNKTQIVNQKKTDFINEINNFKTGKENVIDLSNAVISSLFTENKYAVITNIKYKNSSYEASSDLIAIGDLDNWNALQVAQGSIVKTDNYEVEYTEVTIENYTYNYISGNNQTLTKGKVSSYSFSIDGDDTKFASFEVDGVAYVKDTDYTVIHGSTIITLLPAGITKLNSLDFGTYTTKVTYNLTTGAQAVTGSFTIAKEQLSATSAVKDVTPKTGTQSIIEYVIGMITLAGTGILFVYLRSDN